MSAEQLKRIGPATKSSLPRSKPASLAIVSSHGSSCEQRIARKVDAARRRLVESGRPEQPLASLPPMQLILLDQKRDCEARYDDLIKYTNFPHLAGRGAVRAERPPGGSAFFADALVPALHSSTGPKARLDRRMRCCGTSRHCGFMPLSIMVHCPRRSPRCRSRFPIDPFTGKPFRYQVDRQDGPLPWQPAPRPGKERQLQRPLRGHPADRATPLPGETGRPRGRGGLLDGSFPK